MSNTVLATRNPELPPLGPQGISAWVVLDRILPPPTEDFVTLMRGMLNEEYDPCSETKWETMMALIRDRGWSAQRLFDAVKRLIASHPYSRWKTADLMADDPAKQLYSWNWTCEEEEREEHARKRMEAYTLPGRDPNDLLWRYVDGTTLPPPFELRVRYGQSVYPSPIVAPPEQPVSRDEVIKSLTTRVGEEMKGRLEAEIEVSKLQKKVMELERKLQQQGLQGGDE